MKRNLKFSLVAISLGIAITGFQYRTHLAEQFKFGKIDPLKGASESDSEEQQAVVSPESLRTSEELSILYTTGIDAIESGEYDKAYRVFEEGASYKYAPSMHQLALMLEIGLFNSKTDQERAIKLYDSAAKQGYLESIKYLAQAHESGIFGEVNIVRSTELYRVAGEKGDIDSLSWLRDRSKSDSSFSTPEEVAKWNMTLAANGDMQATIDAGMALYSGNGVKLDKESAIDLFETAAEQGDDSAHTFLASILLYDTDIERKPAEAVVWLSESADRGNPRAQAMLGIVISSLNDLATEGIVIDDKKAFDWVNESLKQEYPLAYSYAGQFYLAATGVDRDLKKAVELFETGAEKGNPDAMVNLGWQLAHGQGVAKDEKRAFEIIRTAADMGYPNAIYNLGWLYEHGIGVEQSYREAINHYRKSADLKDPSGTYNLAELYELGKGFIADEKKALELYQLANKLGDTRALEKINELTAQG